MDQETPVDPAGSMSVLLLHWGANEEEIARRIQADFFPRLRRLSQNALGGLPGAAFEADDVVQSAIKSFCRFMRRQTAIGDKDRDDIWRLLCHFAVCKASRRRERQTRGLRGGRVVPMSDLPGGEQSLEGNALLYNLSTDEFDLILQEAIERLDESLRPVALLVMEGMTQAEIANRLGCSRRTVIRKFDLVKRLLRSALE